MSDKKKTPGIEYSFVTSWEGWDEHGISDLYFYNVILREDVFGAEFIEKYSGKKLDLGLWGQSSLIEIFIEDEDEPIFSSRIKLVLV